MSKRTKLLTICLATSLALTSGLIGAGERSGSFELAAGADTDNTKRNVRDKHDATLTPEDQKETTRDRKLTAAIRRAIVKDDALSTNAHNVKIITRGGAVTLRGPVDSAAEKAQLEQLALKVRGVKRVDNQLDVTAP